MDDFKLSGPKSRLKEGWELLRSGLNLEPPKPIHGQSYLGCRSERFEVELPGGGVATAHSCDVTFNSCISLYEELAPGATLKKVAAPFISEDRRNAPARAPAGAGLVEVCPWCERPHAPNPYKSVEEYDKLKAQQRKSLEAETSAKTETMVRGRLAPAAACILLKILYGARTARTPAAKPSVLHRSARSGRHAISMSSYSFIWLSM